MLMEPLTWGEGVGVDHLSAELFKKRKHICISTIFNIYTAQAISSQIIIDILRLPYIVNTTAAADLATHGASALTGMVLT